MDSNKIYNVVQTGCSGTYNYGDELSQKAVRILLRRLLPKCKITILGSVEYVLKNEHPDADNYITFANHNKCLDAISHCDFWVYGPGTIMPWSMTNSIDFYNINKKVIVWGVGSLRVNNDKHIKMINDCIGISCRDNQSLKFISECINNAIMKPLLCSDPMLYHVRDMKNTRINGITLTSHIENMNISWINNQMRENIYNSLAHAMKQIGGQWIAIPATIGEFPADNDNICHMKLKKLFPELGIVNMEHFDDMTNKLCGLNLYITARLHTGVVAAGSKVPTVFFGLEKILFLLESWGRKELYAGYYADLTTEKILKSLMYAQNIFPGAGEQYTNNKPGIKHIIDNIGNDIDIMSRFLTNIH